MRHGFLRIIAILFLLIFCLTACSGGGEDTFVVGISDRSCRFNEYLYYHSRQDNGAAKLFYEEFRNLFIRE